MDGIDIPTLAPPIVPRNISRGENLCVFPSNLLLQQLKKKLLINEDDLTLTCTEQWSFFLGIKTIDTVSDNKKYSSGLSILVDENFYLQHFLALSEYCVFGRIFCWPSLSIWYWDKDFCHSCFCSSFVRHSPSHSGVTPRFWNGVDWGHLVKD